MRKEDYDQDDMYLYENMDHVDQDKPKVPEIGLDMTRERYQSMTPGQERMEFEPKRYTDDTYSFNIQSDKSAEEVLNKICDQLGVNAKTLDPYRVKTFIDSFKEDPQNEASHNDDQDYDDLEWSNIADENESPEEIEDVIPGQEDADDMHDAEEEEDHALGEEYLYEKMTNPKHLAKNRRFHAPDGNGTKAWRKHNVLKHDRNNRAAWKKIKKSFKESYDPDNRYSKKNYVLAIEDTNPWNILHKLTEVLGINEKYMLPKRKKFFVENCLEYHKRGDQINIPFFL